MDWEKWRTLNPRRFVEKLDKKLRQGLTNNDLIGLYNALMVSVPDDPKYYATLSDHIRLFFRRKKLPTQAVLFDELSARAYFSAGDPEKLFACLHAMLDISDSAESITEVLEITKGALDDIDGMGASIDHRPKVMAAATSIYERLDRKRDIALVHIKAAMHYSTYGAGAAAYRSITEAGEIAEELQDIDLLCSVLETMQSTAADLYAHEEAIKIADRAFELFESRDEAPPPSFLSNSAVVRMRIGDYEGASRDLRMALQTCPADSPARYHLTLNLGTCLRNLNDLPRAAEMLTAARELIGDDTGPEALVELGLSSSRLANLMPEFGSSAAFLADAAKGLDSALRPVLRLHHRRGLRERYIPRFETAMRELPSEGDSDALIDVVAALRGNGLGDWLSVLAWKALLNEREDIPQALKAEISRIVEVLRNFGVPHLHGYREKYDDAWSVINKGATWDDLSRVVAQLATYESPPPHFAASLASTSALLRKRLAHGDVLVTLTYSGPNPLLWTFFGNRYSRVELSSTNYMEWKVAEFSYGLKELTRSEFARKLQDLVAACKFHLEPVLEEVARINPGSILFLLDFGGAFPITPVVQTHPLLLTRMQSGALEVRLVPALHAANDTVAGPLHGVAALSDSDEDLLLPPFEGRALADASGLELVTSDISDEDIELAEFAAKADVLLVSTHGLPVSLYKDPIVAAMNDGHPISVDGMQRFAADLPLKLVLLNTCHSAVGGASNFFKQFRTSDAVSYPALFLLNGQAVATAAQWPITDTVSFVFTCLVGDALREGLAPPYAVSKANATLRRLSKEQVLKLLERIPDPGARERAALRMTNAPEEGMYSHPYLSAPIALFGLL
ncbi:tetratricopeptide repeat protein [Paraburkholderia sp. GAS42]|jgi:tetratricopeptide (TPR) repeat protein|uniref:tetratricopeptide repeat protein n=1 Tax=Paraburkholderia sp. GAS42 TaxID=3035135 RepID=UPI003D205194